MLLLKTLFLDYKQLERCDRPKTSQQIIAIAVFKIVNLYFWSVSHKSRSCCTSRQKNGKGDVLRLINKFCLSCGDKHISIYHQHENLRHQHCNVRHQHENFHHQHCNVHHQHENFHHQHCNVRHQHENFHHQHCNVRH
jgi:hypothetical protein